MTSALESSEFNRRQVLYLLLGDVEPDSGVNGGDGADRDGDLLPPPQMAFPEENMGHRVIGRVDDKAFYLADLAVDGMDVLVALHLGLPQRNRVAHHRRRPMAQAHADSHTGDRTTHPHAADVAVALDRSGLTVAAAVAAILHQLDFLGRIEPVELGKGTVQPDLARLRVDQVDRHESP